MTSHYYGQFVISRKERYVPVEFDVNQFGAWILYSHKSLPVSVLHTEDGCLIGCVIGHLIKRGATIFGANNLVLEIPSTASAARIETAIHQFIGQSSGRFVCLIDCGDFQRLYLDAAGSLACVYGAGVEVVASTPGLILDKKDYYASIDADLASVVSINNDGWYPAGLTPHPTISRLMPNHYLELVTWKPVRHWPKKEIPLTSSLEQTVGTIADSIKDNIQAIVSEKLAYLPITAGRDSRMLLACSRARLEKIQLIIFVDKKESVDKYTVKKLQEIHKLSVEYIPITFASIEQREQWNYDIGHCLGGRISEIHRTLGSLDQHRVILPGVAGEVGRGYLWKSKDKEDTEITADDLLLRLHLPRHRVLRHAINIWLDGVGNLLNTYQLLDVAYNEIRMGGWAGPQNYGQARFVDHMFPLIDRRIFESILSLPAEYRRGQQLPVDIIQRQWPELLSLPFNSFTGLRNYYEKAKKIRRVPTKIRKLITRLTPGK